MAEAAYKLMTLAEFLDWDAPGETRWELYSGVPVAMAPPMRTHGRIAATLGGLLFAGLKGKPPCQAESEVGILSPTRRNSWYSADVAVSCTPARSDEQYTAEPVLIAEILSASTQDNDRTVKLPDYRRIPSVREIVLLDSRKMFGEVHRRTESGAWTVDLLTAAEDRLVLTSCGLDVSLGEVYDGVVFEPADAIDEDTAVR